MIIRIGLLCETDHDQSFYEPIIKRMLEEEGFRHENEIKVMTCGTSIIGRVDEALLYFFSPDLVDIAFFITDHDNGEVVGQIKKWRKDLSKTKVVPPVVFGYPDPHMEKWICCDQDSMKKVFSLKAGDSHKCKPDPKSYVQKLMNEADGYEIKQEYYRQLGEEVSIPRLSSHNKEFRSMAEEFKTVMRDLAQPSLRL